ncbi:hypothetical protein ABW20_dc0104312 [Dactylellina cionopaga]|nr:hypothetical protein ABW20_dc0104312 [Dactylellina cionopaga]
MRSAICFLSLLALANALVPAPRPLDAQGASADVYIVNDWGKSLTITTSEPKSMSQGLQSPIKLPANSKSSKYSISADGKSQSSFKISLKPDGSSKESKINVQLGQSPLKTGYTFESTNPTTQAGALLAPVKAQEGGKDFDFYIFSGQGDSTATVNNLLDSKVKPKLAEIKDKPVTVTAAEGVEVTINEVVNPSIKSSYATLEWSGFNVKVNAVIDVSAEVKLNVNFKGKKQDVTVKVVGFSLLATASGSITALSEFTVSRLQASVDKIDLGNDVVVDIVAIVYPALAPVLKDSFKLASLVNTSENAKVITLVNNAIKKLASSS